MAGVHAAPLTHVQSPGKWRWDVDSYYAAWEKGVFGEEAKLELLEGEVYKKLSPQKAPHATGVRMASEALSHVLLKGSLISVQLPLRLDWRNEPEPDIAVLRGDAQSFADRHPTAADTLLVVEVSDRTLATDRKRKLQIYAQFGIQEYWIINLRDAQLEVYREPRDGTYLYQQVLTHGESVTPLFSAKTLSVSDLVR